MIKFVFNKNASTTKVAANIVRDTYTNLDSFDVDQDRRKKEVEERENQTKSRLRKADLDAPFVVMSGDSSWHPVTNPDVERPSYEFVHKSLPDSRGRSKRNLPYARHFKQLLRGRVGQDYERVELGPEHYSKFLGKKEISLIQKHHRERGGSAGEKAMLEAYRPVSSAPKVTDEFSEFLKIKDSGKKRRVKGRDTNNGTPTTRSLDSSDPVSIFANSGEDGLSELLSSSSGMPYKVGNGLCQCGEEAVNHVNIEEARAHYEKTGEHLEIHPFVPRASGSGENLLSQSPLLNISRPVVQEDGTTKIMEGQKAFDDKNGVKGNHIPMVRIGTKTSKFRRLIIGEKRKEGYGGNIANQDTLVEEQLQPCPTCKGGQDGPNPDQNENIVLCNDCSTPGHINYKEKIVDGKPTLLPHTKVVSDGLLQYINEDDAPACRSGCVGGKHYNDRTSTEGTTCRTCGGTGKDLTAFPCSNHQTDGSGIRITSDNTCSKCNNTGFLSRLTTKITRRSPEMRVRDDGIDYEGNLRFASRFKNGIAHSIKGMLWKGHANKDCTRCNGDDEYQTKFGLPCNCRIAHPTDPNVLPGSINVIERDNVNLPEHHYQNFMVNAYDNDMTSAPHQIYDLPNKVDPATGVPTFETYRQGTTQTFSPGTKGVDQRSFLGLWTPGKRIPKTVMAKLRKTNETNQKSVNAPFCAASANLEAVNEEFSQNFANYPDNTLTPPRGQRVKKRWFSTDSIDPEAYPERMRPAVSDLARTISSIPDSYTGRYNRLAQTALSHAAMMSGTDDPSKDRNWSRFQRAQRRLLSTTSRFHGADVAQEVGSKLDALVPSATKTPVESNEQEAINVQKKL